MDKRAGASVPKTGGDGSIVGVGRKIALASKNPGKIAEFQAMLSGLGFEIVPYEGPDISEIGKTFEENARIKAEAASLAMGLPAFADDSGLVIFSLSGEPGVRSHEYANEMGGPQAAMDDILRRLKGLDRGAKFVSCLALVGFGDVLTFTGEINGWISETKRGEGGFGYDPIFVPNGTGDTFAEMDSNEKNAISHRARSFGQLVEFFVAEARREAVDARRAEEAAKRESQKLKRESGAEEFEVEMEQASVQKFND